MHLQTLKKSRIFYNLATNEAGESFLGASTSTSMIQNRLQKRQKPTVHYSKDKPFSEINKPPKTPQTLTYCAVHRFHWALFSATRVGL